MVGCKLYNVVKFKNLLRRMGSWRSEEREMADGRTGCGTLAVYAGSLMIRSDLLAELDTEPGTVDTVRGSLSSTQGDRDSAL
ncbi:hypothetical protein ALQ89_04898 [Pseudomonas amygdali pv. tabaci]|uniref:Uncharacterized protein n=1 Tax=Pseudomonas amygdali pv. tabaci TaxID=322 RepID=A0AAX1VMM9_PSEAJ|nr:hypothetical protein ALQ89_04898 [Pseudomonas amygdali pv. tabaci]